MSLVIDRSVEALTKAPEKRKQSIKLVLIILVVLLFLTFLTIFISWEESKYRDSVRIADMALIQATMQEIYFENASYDISDYCKKGEALLTESCWNKLQYYFSSMAFLNDPKSKAVCNPDNCVNTPCAYSLVDISKDNYKILFHLEHGFQNLEAGCHYLDKNGIH